MNGYWVVIIQKWSHSVGEFWGRIRSLKANHIGDYSIFGKLADELEDGATTLLRVVYLFCFFVLVSTHMFTSAVRSSEFRHRITLVI